MAETLTRAFIAICDKGFYPILLLAIVVAIVPYVH